MSSKTKKQKGVQPKLRFPEFSGSWNVPTLGEISDRIVEKVGTKSLETVSISAGIGFVSQATKFSRDISGEQYKNYTVLNKGDFSYNKGNSKKFPQGCVYKLKEFTQVAAPNVFISFKFKKDYVSDFYQGYFESNFHGEQLKKFITSGARSNGLLNISADEFFSVKLPTPVDRKEQQKISDFLSSLDELIEAEDAKLEALQQHKKGLMQELFPAEGETLPNRRFPEFQNAPEWDEKPLGTIAEVLPGFGFPEKYQGQVRGTYPFYKVSDISNSLQRGEYFIKSAAHYIDEATLKILRAKPLPVGTTIFARIGEAIRLNRRAITTVPCVIDNNVAGLKSIDGQSTDLFLYYTLLRINLADHSGGAVPSVNKSTIENIPVICPDAVEQKRIAEFLSSIDDLITAQSQKLDALRDHKKGLMQQLFPTVSEVQE